MKPLIHRSVCGGELHPDLFVVSSIVFAKAAESLHELHQFTL
jgi:hypothetical protein